ncbi:MAG: hypothetical protein HC914_12590 [Chloroflexaceae bacterium]|nr:hypothetical protein [Chloroflexaceae bacterium]
MAYEHTQHSRPIRAVAVDPPTHRLVYVDANLAVGSWEWRTQRGVSFGRMAAANATSVVLDPQGRFVVRGGRGFTESLSDGIPFMGGPDPTIYIHAIGTLNEMEKMRGHRGRVNALALSEDGTLLVSGGEDGTVRLWRVPEVAEEE